MQQSVIHRLGQVKGTLPWKASALSADFVTAWREGKKVVREGYFFSVPYESVTKELLE